LDALGKDFVEALPGTLHQPASLQSLRNCAISWRLLIEAVLRRDAVRKPPRADKLNVLRKLAYEDRPLEPVVPVADRVQKSLAHHLLIKGRNVINEQAFLVMLQI